MRPDQSDDDFCAACGREFEEGEPFANYAPMYEGRINVVSDTYFAVCPECRAQYEKTIEEEESC